MSLLISDLFLIWLAGAVCFVAALERPDRRMFWLSCCYFCGVCDVVIGVTA